MLDSTTVSGAGPDSAVEPAVESGSLGDTIDDRAATDLSDLTDTVNADKLSASHEFSDQPAGHQAVVNNSTSKKTRNKNKKGNRSKTRNRRKKG